MSNFEKQIEIQRKKVFKSPPKIQLISPCEIGNGIIKLCPEEKKQYIDKFNHEKPEISFFVPASGSGSRMFQFIFDYLSNNNKSEAINTLIMHLHKFAFFEKFDLTIKEKISSKSLSINEILRLIVDPKGLNLASFPKGLIPFHKKGKQLLNPFQEQLLQGMELHNNAKFHFTVQEEFKIEIQKSIAELKTKVQEISFSYQDKSTNSIAFKENGETLLSDDKKPFRRPAGHGALIHNLDKIEDEYVFIKNIDNVQHFEKRHVALKTWRILAGVLMKFKEEAREILDSPSLQALKTLNNKYQFCSEQSINQISSSKEILNLLNRPSRICGMVINKGLPGGGPFWVENNGEISKQIVEKAQISEKQDQVNILHKSSHFNPVLIVASPCDIHGKKINLNNHIDHESYFIVNKNQKGKAIKYMELPGLWNGAMSDWNSIFIEVPMESFSPVKSINDLLKPPHNAN